MEYIALKTVVEVNGHVQVISRGAFPRPCGVVYDSDGSRLFYEKSLPITFLVASGKCQIGEFCGNRSIQRLQLPYR